MAFDYATYIQRATMNSMMAKDTAISLRLSTEQRDILTEFASDYRDVPRPGMVDRSGLIWIALFEMAERHDAAHGTNWHEQLAAASE